MCTFVLTASFQELSSFSVQLVYLCLAAAAAAAAAVMKS